MLREDGLLGLYGLWLKEAAHMQLDGTWRTLLPGPTT